MTGLIVLAFAGLLMQDSTPHPSTRSAYQAPVIRPFEPGPDFGRERPQGDSGAERHRRPLEAPVTVEAYAGSYEYTPDVSEVAYDQGVAAAEIRADQAAGPLDGAWRIIDGSGRTLYELVLIDAGIGPVEGGWRGAWGSGPAISDGTTLTLEGAGILSLERSGNGWRGILTVNGQTRPVRLIRPD
jgi:hypothetical protein